MARALGMFQLVAEDRGFDAAKAALEARHIAPTRARLARLGASPAAIEDQIYDFKCAIRDLSWSQMEVTA